MRAAFIVNNRNKGRFVGRSVSGALSQTYPCEIIISDYASTDSSCAEIEKAIRESPRGAEHDVSFLHCDLGDSQPTMVSCNAHIKWIVDRIGAEWVFQCSSDDYSLPDRVKVCMKALTELNNRGLDTVGLATTMKFDAPGRPEHGAVSGYPTESGYVSAGVGIHRLAYGSTIWGYRREWLLKVGLDVPCTLDVYLGYLASLDRGYYVIADPQHVHYMAEDNENIGFQGKMRAAEQSGDKETIARLNELNRFQLFECYFLAAKRQSELYPMAKPADTQAMIQMLVNQAVGWYEERANLHKQKITPGVLWA